LKRDITTFDEGKEPPVFWEILGGKKEYFDLDLIRRYKGDARLYRCSFSTGDFEVILNFSFLISKEQNLKI
jgi:hypothetical protein